MTDKPGAVERSPASTGAPISLADYSALDLASLLLRQRRLVVVFPLLLALLTAVVTSLLPHTFVATTSFVLQQQGGNRIPANLLGLAGQFGLSLAGEGASSPRFSADIARSRRLSQALLLSRFQDPRSGAGSGDSITLLELLGRGGKDTADSLERGVKRLGTLVGASVDNQTGIVRLTAESRYPAVSAEIVNRLVQLLNEFNTTTRQSQARERRKFVEQRLAQSEVELRTAEESLKVFHQRNRQWERAPELTFDEGQLRRQVDVQQEIYLTLRREYETSRIEEVNDTPVITILDVAIPPTRKSGPRRMLWTALALFGGGVIGLAAAATREYTRLMRETSPQDYSAFVSLRRSVRDELGRAFFRRKPPG